MRAIERKAPLYYRVGTNVRNMIGYPVHLVALHLSRSRSCRDDMPEEPGLSAHMRGYPSNHQYMIRDAQLIPRFQLYERWRLVTGLWPAELESFLDIGCCRGYYVLTAAQQPSCRFSMGIDVCPSFISTCRKVANYLQLDNTRFDLATIEKLAASPGTYRGPFQTVLLIGTYHYLFWGSSRCSHCFRDHNEILASLARLCTHRLILSGRLDLNRLPASVRRRVSASKEASSYNTETFLKHAGVFFDVRVGGYLGTYPLFVMDKKKSPLEQVAGR